MEKTDFNIVNNNTYILSQNHNYMFEKGLIFGGFNPLHYGHLNLIRTGLINTKSIDIYVGKKQMPERLPYEVRVNTLRGAINDEKLEDKISIISPEKGLFFLDKSDYSVLIVGSDFLNHISPKDNTFKQKERDFVSYFRNIIMVERPGDQFCPEARQVIKKSAYLIEYKSKIPVSARKIRANYSAGDEIRDMIPGYVMEHIKDYLEMFHQERKKNL